MCLVPALIIFLSFTQQFYKNLKNMSVLAYSDGFCFCEEWKLVSTNLNQIQVKQIILKDSGG